MWKLPLVFAFCVFQVTVVQSTGHYSVVAPGTIRANSNYDVVITMHKTTEPCEIKIGITGPSFNKTKSVTVNPMTAETVQFKVPDLESGDYNLTAEGLKGIEFQNSTKLNFAENKPSVYIQTDKATYKPSDLVQFRIVFLDENLKPSKTKKPIFIVISDASENRIKQFNDIKIPNGIYSEKLQLSEFPNLGSWSIEVLVGDQSIETKKFEVAKYVLPKFEVKVEAPKDVAVHDGKIPITVRAKYTYGKSVKGKVVISLKPTYSYSYHAHNLTAEKTIDIDGKTHVEFDLEKDLQLDTKYTHFPPLTVTAVVEEELTSSKLNGSTTVTLHPERYNINGVNPPYIYYTDKPIKMTVAVTNLDGSPVRDSKNPVKLIVKPGSYHIYRGGDSLSGSANLTEINLESNLDEHGMATFTFTISENETAYYTVKASYLETTRHISSLSKFKEHSVSEGPLKITVQTEKPRLGKNVSLEVRADKTISYFVYTIVARGNIIKSELVEVPENRNFHIIKLATSFEMVPQASIMVHYVFDNNLEFEEANINFEKEFANKVSIEAPVQAKPGENITLKVETDSDSVVGLLGVDQSVLLLKSGNDFDKEQILNGLNQFETRTPWMLGYSRYPGTISGVVTMTDAHFPHEEHVPPFYALADEVNISDVAYSVGAVYKGKKSIIKVRKEFPETWIWHFSDSSDSDGIALTKQVPDTITSWVITGFALSPTTGFGLTEVPSKIQVFQPFFISTNLPYSVKRGEVIAVPIIIFNYMDKPLDVTITMDNEDSEYEFTEATNEVLENPLDEIKREKRTTVPSNTGKSVSYMIRPKKVGLITLKITAVSPLAGDAIHQILRVEPEGVTKYVNRAFFLNLNDKSEQKESVSIDIPSDAVPDSEHVDFSVVGDLLGPTIKNLDKLVRMPYGCGEQNMVNFVPNILVLRYLESTGQMKPSIEEKAKKFLEIGYQRELTYKHDDGSYSAFGKSDESGSTWLTAYVVRSFHQALNYTDIDPKVIAEGLQFLVSKQAANGSFPEVGKVIDKQHSGGADKGIALTAFVLLAFLENEESVPKHKQTIDRALQYVSENLKDIDDQYALAISAAAMQMAKHPDAEQILVKLNGVAKQESDRKWWSKEVENKKQDSFMWYFAPRSNDVEITAYIVSALLDRETVESVLPIIKWLISQRNSNGGFSSTQDTVVGLEALIKFARHSGAGSGKMNIEFYAGEDDSKRETISVDAENSLVLQTYELPKSSRQIHFSAKGTGRSMVQVSYHYNVATTEKEAGFKLTINTLSPTSKQMNIAICSEYVPINADDKESSMAVMEVNMPSGYTADPESIESIKDNTSSVKRTEIKKSNSLVIVYFESLKAAESRCISLEAIKSHAVAKQKPAAVEVYDYYNNHQRSTEYYQVNSSLCDICEGADCGEGCKSQE